MTEHQDPFLAICESLRLHALTRYTTDELIAELKRREVAGIGEMASRDEDQDTDDGYPSS